MITVEWRVTTQPAAARQKYINNNNNQQWIMDITQVHMYQLALEVKKLRTMKEQSFTACILLL